jgi:adenosine deaminase
MDLKKIEKVELHRHLEGSLRIKTLIELAVQNGIEVPAEKKLQDEMFLVRSPMKDLQTVLNKFWMTQSVLSSEEILTRVTFEAIEDAYNEGIRILELRYAPTFIQKDHTQLTWENIHRSIYKGVELAKNIKIAVGLICIIQRNRPIEEALSVCQFALEHRESFVGLDLADDEDAIPARNFKNVFALAQKQSFPITIHAGESNTPSSPQNVIDAIELLGANRIGHGLQIINSKEAINLVKKNKIPLELCPTSNWLTNAIPNLSAHPIKKLNELGVLTTINSDDPGIFGINLTNEYNLLANSYQYILQDFNLVNDIAAQASFISLAKKQAHWPRPIHLIN